MKVLFCDSFSQEPPDRSVYNTWSVIEFSVPVVLEQIRVLPRGVFLHEKLRADGQCGITSPGNFRIDFFACDEKNDKASTFENLCALEYNEGGYSVAFPKLPFVTTKLLCSGRYAAVTIAVFGAEASDSDGVRLIHQRRNEAASNTQRLLPQPESFQKTRDEPTVGQYSGPPIAQMQPPVPIPISYQSTHVSKPGSNHAFGNDQNTYSSNSYDSRGYPDRRTENFQYSKPPLLPTPTGGGKDRFSQQQRSNRYQYRRYQPYDADANYQKQNLSWSSESYSTYSGDTAYSTDNDEAIELFNASKDQGDDESWEDAEYEEISDEELDEETAANVEAMVAEDMLLPSSMMSFNPFHMETFPLSHFNSPDVTEFERIRNKLHDQDVDLKKTNKEKSEASKLKNLIEDTLNYCNVKLENKSERHVNQKLTVISSGKEKDWVINLEKMVSLVAKGLPYLEVKSDLDYAFVLSSWAVFALSLDSSVSQLIGVNVRAVKAGLQLTYKLCQTSADIVEHFSTVYLTRYLFDILSALHVASSIKILAIHVLDAMTDWPMQLYQFMYGESDESISDKDEDNKSRTGYAEIIRLCLDNKTARVTAALNQLVRKVHIYECMHEVQNSVQALVVDKIPDEYVYVSDEDDYNHDEDSEMPSSPHNEEEDVETSIKEQSNTEVMSAKGKRRIACADLTVNNGNETMEDDTIAELNEADMDKFVAMEAVFPLADVAISDDDLVKIADSLKEITAAFRNPHQTIGQYSLQHFPLSRRHVSLGANDDECRANNTLYRMSDESGLLLSVQALLTLPFVSGHRSIFSCCSSLLEQLMSTKSGLIYLLSNSDSILHIAHHLLKSSPHLDIESSGSAGHLGAKLALHIQALQSLDHICSLLESSSEEEEIEEELFDNLKMLFSLTYLGFGKEFVCKVLAIDDFLKPVITCLWYPTKLSDPDPVVEKTEEEKKPSDKSDEEGSDEKKDSNSQAIQHKSAINGYAAALLHFMFETSDDASYIYRHITDLVRSCMSDLHVTCRNEEFKKFLSPLTKQLQNEDADVAKLILLIKDKATLLEWSSLCIDGPGITTALRLLCHLCLKDQQGSEGTDADSRRRILNLFSHDCLNVLLLLGEQLHKSLHYFCHGIRSMAAGLISSTHNLILSTCKCIFSLLHSMIYHILDSAIDAGSVDDAHIAQVSIALYSDLYILLRPIDTAMLHCITGKVVGILSLFFTRNPDTDKPSPILNEMVKYAEGQCDNFVPTLLLLSQLLPLPLPIVTPHQPSDSARITALATCKLWSSILTHNIEQLTAFLLPLSSSISRPVVEIVVVLMQQIIDLSPIFASSIIKKYIDEISPLLVNPSLANKEENSEEAKEEEDQKEVLMLSSEQITAINTFAEILTLPAAKAAMISAMSTDGEGILDLWTYAASEQTPDEDVAAALLLASILIDTVFSLLPVDDTLESLAMAFPSTAHIKAVIDLTMAKISSSSALVFSRVYVVLGLLQQNRVAVPYLRRALKSDTKPLGQSLKQIGDSFDLSSQLWIDALHNYIEFLSLLTDPNLDVTETKKDSKISLNLSQLKYLLKFDEDSNKLLRNVEAKLSAAVLDDSTADCHYDYMLNKVSALLQSLAVVDAKDKIPGLHKEEIPDPGPLLEQFTDRPVFVLGSDDPNMRVRLSITAPLPYYGAAELSDDRMVQCDLIATAEKFCPGYDLAEELSKLAKAIDVQHVAEETEAMEKRRKKIETYTARLGKSLTFMKRSHGLLIAQQRTGRGRGRGRGNPSNRPFDLFRHRKQNTSRPPSMHVDDFVAADEEESQEAEDVEPTFKSPPPPLLQVRRPAPQPYKSRAFVPRGRGGRGSRISGGYRGRGGYHQQNTLSPLSKFRSRPSSAGNRGGRPQDRFRPVSSSRLSSRLSFSPHEGFKTNKQDQGSWSGASRDYSSPSYRGRGSKLFRSSRGNFSMQSPNNRWDANLSRRGRAYNKPRGKHIRSSTR